MKIFSNITKKVARRFFYTANVTYDILFWLMDIMQNDEMEIKNETNVI